MIMLQITHFGVDISPLAVVAGIVFLLAGVYRVSQGRLGERQRRRLDRDTDEADTDEVGDHERRLARLRGLSLIVMGTILVYVGRSALPLA